MQSLFSAPYLIIYLHEGPVPVLELSWLGYATSHQFREAALRALALAEQHQIKGWLSDDRRLGAVRPRDLDWGGEVALPRLAALGLQHFAQLEPEDALNRRTIDGVYQQVVPRFPFEMRRFADLEQARAWASGC